MSQRKWSDDEEVNSFLNTETGNAAEIARLNRIMQHRTIEAMNGLEGGLKGVMGTIHRAAQLAVDKADEVANKVEIASNAQARQQRTVVRLTWVLAGATVLYVAINCVVVYEMSRANSIQHDMVVATYKAVDAAIAANDLQRRSLAVVHQEPQR